jgi:hypothetical protein
MSVVRQQGGSSMKWQGRWAGCEAVVMASGPSLTMEDVETVRQWREAAENRRVIVTNTTYQAALWADALFFHDFKWWGKYKHDVVGRFTGDLVTLSSINSERVKRLTRPAFNGFGNSGAAAIELAVFAGCRRVITLGLDCQYTNNRKHWHGDHPRGLGNAKSMPKWANSFKRLAGHAKGKGVEVINASRATSLTCFALQPLEIALNDRAGSMPASAA